MPSIGCRPSHRVADIATANFSDLHDVVARLDPAQRDGVAIVLYAYKWSSLPGVGGLEGNSVVKLGIIGYGVMGERLATAASRHERIEINAVWDPTPERSLYAEECGLPVSASSDAVIESSDCVYIACPPANHVEHARAALDAGRAIFLEKPLAVDLVEAETLVRDIADDSAAAVNFPMVSYPAVTQLGQWREEGAIGAPTELSIEAGFAAWPRPWQQTARWLADRKEGGFTREVLSHFVFLTIRQFGLVTLTGATCTYPNSTSAEISVSATLEAGALPVSLRGEVGATDADEHNSWTLRGTSGAIRLRNWSVAERLDGGRWLQPEAAFSIDAVRSLVLRRQLDKLVAMTSGEPHDLATLDEALQVQRVVETILRSGD